MEPACGQHVLPCTSCTLHQRSRLEALARLLAQAAPGPAYRCLNFFCSSFFPFSLLLNLKLTTDHLRVPNAPLPLLARMA